MKILVASRSESALKSLQQQITRCGSYETEGLLMLKGNMDPLRLVDYRPDVLVLHAGEYVVDELRALAERPGRDRPALVVVGDCLPQEAAKHAMRAGASDFISEHDSEELAESLRRLDPRRGERGGGKTVVVINAKGGSGGTFIATSLAHLSAISGAGDTVVVDLDFQYGSLPHYLDVKPKRGLLEALEHAHELDEVAVTAYAVQHDSGLHVMAPLPKTQSAADFNLADRMAALLRVLKRRYGTVVLDLPRHLDEFGSQVLQEADQIIMVLQQSLLAVHDAVRLKTVLVKDLGIAGGRIVTLVNRYGKTSALDTGHISSALDDDDLVLVPNQYKLVAQCLDMGVLVIEQASGAPVVRGLLGLQSRVLGQSAPQGRGFLETVLRRRG